MINLSIIDDETAFIDFFRSAAVEMPDMTCLKTAQSIDEYLQKPVKFKHKHFLFLDIHIGKDNSIERIPEILKKYPETEIVIYSVDEDYSHLMAALKLGACGYIIKKFDKPYLQNFLQVLAEEGAAISPEMARKLIFAINGNEKNSRLNEILSSKEIKVLSALADGWTYQYIADDIGISINTVRHYIKQIYKKLNVNSRGQAVKIFQDTA